MLGLSCGGIPSAVNPRGVVPWRQQLEGEPAAKIRRLLEVNAGRVVHQGDTGSGKAPTRWVEDRAAKRAGRAVCARQADEIVDRTRREKMQRDMDSLCSEVSPASTGDAHRIARKGGFVSDVRRNVGRRSRNGKFDSIQHSVLTAKTAPLRPWRLKAFQRS